MADAEHEKSPIVEAPQEIWMRGAPHFMGDAIEELAFLHSVNLSAKQEDRLRGTRTHNDREQAQLHFSDHWDLTSISTKSSTMHGLHICFD